MWWFFWKIDFSKKFRWKIGENGFKSHFPPNIGSDFIKQRDGVYTVDEFFEIKSKISAVRKNRLSEVCQSFLPGHWTFDKPYRKTQPLIFVTVRVFITIFEYARVKISSRSFFPGKVNFVSEHNPVVSKIFRPTLRAFIWMNLFAAGKFPLKPSISSIYPKHLRLTNNDDFKSWVWKPSWLKPCRNEVNLMIILMDC